MDQELKCKIYLWMLGAAKKENEILYSAGWTNDIFKTNVLTGETKHIACFETETPARQTMYGIVIWTEEKYFFLPYNEKLLAIYDPETESIKYMDLLPVECTKAGLRIGMGFLFDQYIVMVSAEKNVPLILYNYKDNSVHYIEDIISLIENHITYDSYVFAQGYYIYDNKVYLVIQGTDILVQVDLAAKKSSLIKMDFDKEKNCGINAMTGMGDKLYLFEEYGGMIVWGIKEQKVLLHKFFKKELSRGEFQVQNALTINNSIWIFLVGTEKASDIILKYDCLSDVVEEIDLKDSDIVTGGFDRKLYGYLFAQIVEKDAIIACSANSSQFIYIDEKKNLIKKMSLECSDKEYVEDLLKKYVPDENLVENGLQALCDNLLQQPEGMQDKLKGDLCSELILKSIGV